MNESLAADLLVESEKFMHHHPGGDNAPQHPVPHPAERPSLYADRLGQWYAALVTADRKKLSGQYLTPVEVARSMARLYHPLSEKVHVLDPGAGAGVLSCALCEALAEGVGRPNKIHLETYEIDTCLAGYLEDCLGYLQQWLSGRGVELHFQVHRSDFIESQAQVFRAHHNLFSDESEAAPNVDVVIANPPYFKLPKSDPRAQIAASIVYGQPNIYAIFMALAAQLLKPQGQLIFITPRSYTAGPYFRLFRERFFATMKPHCLHLFDSRQEAFGRDEVLQESVILAAQRVDNWQQEQPCGKVRISISHGVKDLASASMREVDVSEVIDCQSRDQILSIPVDGEDDEAIRIVNSWTGSLHAYQLDISTGPVVPFRAVSLLSQSGNIPATHAPLLWMQHVSAMKIQWPIASKTKPQYVAVNELSRPLLVANKNYVLMRRFSAKEESRRLVAAPYLAQQTDSPLVGLENHLNYIYRPKGSLEDEEVYGLAALFNSSLLDRYFRVSNGNTQVSATELRAMPLPPLSTIRELGRRILSQGVGMAEIDVCLSDVLGICHAAVVS